MHARLHLIFPFCSACLLPLAGTAQTTSAPVLQAPQLRLIETSVDVITTAGGSTADEGELETLQGGAHDPKKNGFTLQQAELSLTGNAGTHLRGQAHVLMTGDGIELEEAYLSSPLPRDGWDFRAGYFLTEFGRINASHPHAWAWLDQPVIATRFFGGEGLRNAGVRVARRLPLPWSSELLVGVQGADGEFAASFLGGEIAHGHGDDGHDTEPEHGEEENHEEGAGGIGGRAVVDRETEGLDDLLYSVRWANAGELGETTTAHAGLSALTGPNASAEGASTWIAGADLTLRWTPAHHHHGFPFVQWESEAMYRNYEAGALEIGHEGGEPERIAADTLKDYGVVSQLQYGFKPGWIAGIRGEFATGEGESLGGRDHDPYRSDRIRVSPSLSWLPTAFTRVRLQYNYDDADHLDDTAHTVWISLEGLWGAHPAGHCASPGHGAHAGHEACDH